MGLTYVVNFLFEITNVSRGCDWTDLSTTGSGPVSLVGLRRRVGLASDGSVLAPNVRQKCFLALFF